MTASLTAPMPVRWPVLRPFFRANASRPFITSWPVLNTRRYVFASPSLRRAAFGRWEAEFPAPTPAGAATASPAAAKKHRRVLGSVPERAIALSFPGLRVRDPAPCRAVRGPRYLHWFISWGLVMQARCRGTAREIVQLGAPAGFPDPEW